MCFCGGPRRFAECCKQAVDERAKNQHAAVNTDATDVSDFATAETRARADVAQYVIWVRQHTAPTINSAPVLHRQMAEIDVLALDSLIQELRRAQKASGGDDTFVPQLRHLAKTIGIPNISARLIALASEWFFRAGRIEEGILELDRLGNLRNVGDALALMTAARFCDLDTRAHEEILRGAVSVALCKEERWTAQLQLAGGLFERNAKQEALRLADVIIDVIIVEAGAPDGSAGALAEATLLRWRITRTQSDFETALTALDQDPGRGRHAGTLIDEGKCDEAEALLAGPIKDGDIVAKLLIVDARLRSGKREAARDRFLTIDDQVPAHLQYPYGVTAALVAMFLRDDRIRRRAIEALGGLPAAAVESDQDIQNHLDALREDNWGGTA